MVNQNKKNIIKNNNNYIYIYIIKIKKKKVIKIQK